MAGADPPNSDELWVCPAEGVLESAPSLRLTVLFDRKDKSPFLFFFSSFSSGGDADEEEEEETSEAPARLDSDKEFFLRRTDAPDDDEEEEDPKEPDGVLDPEGSSVVLDFLRPKSLVFLRA